MRLRLPPRRAKKLPDDGCAVEAVARCGAWALVVAWAAFIFFMSAHTGSDFQEGTDFVAQVKQWLDHFKQTVLGVEFDIVSPAAHFCAYLILGALLQNALRRHIAPRHALVAAVVIASAYGVSDEIHQLFVPGRACDPVDWVVDTLGALLGANVWAALARCEKRSSPAAQGTRGE